MTIKEIRKNLIDLLESVVLFCYGWLTDNKEALGNITYAWHIMLLFLMFTMIIISHVIYPALWFQIFVFIIAIIIWVQHCILHFCVCTSLEIRYLGKNANIAIDGVLNTFNIPTIRENRIGVTILMTSMVVFFLGLELIARGNLGVRRHYGLSTFA